MVKDNECPRVLVISHNSLSDTRNNGKTILSFFKEWNEDSLAQIYKTNEIPDTEKCKKYFHLSDKDILRGALFRRKAPGVEIVQSENEVVFKENNVQSIVKSIFRKRIPLLLLVQDLFWNMRWDKSKLYEWIERFNPDVLFLQCGSPTIDELALNLSKRYNIPLFFEITDDYVSPKFTIDPFFWMYYNRILTATKRAIKAASKVIVIGEKMKNDYSKRFGGDYYVAMNSILFDNKENSGKDYKKFKIVYTGNLELDRWKVIYHIAKTLEKEDILREKVTIDIYSATKLKKVMKKRLGNCKNIVFHGKKNSLDVVLAQKSANALLHVEDFNKKNKYITRYSISTKIPEYMASGTCIIAVGPKDVASIEYISKNDLGFVCSSTKEKEIIKIFKMAINSPEIRDLKINKAYNYALRYHNQDYISRDIREYIIQATQKKTVNI